MEMRLFLSLLALFVLLGGSAQTDVELTSDKGESFTIQTKQFVLSATSPVTPTTLSPSILILGLREAYASEAARVEFLKYLKGQKYLWKYRSLRKSSEMYALLPPNQTLENQMFKIF